MKFKVQFLRTPLFHINKKEGTFFSVPMILSLIVLLIIVGCCIFAPLLAPYSPTVQDLSSSLAQPSSEHILGADKMGRDLFSRLLYGGRTTLLSALGVVGISTFLGVPLGLFSAYFGGRLDAVIGRICDIVLSFPSLLLAFIFVAGLGRGMGSAVLALGIVYIPMITRLMRSLTLVEKNKTYVEAAQSIGYNRLRIMFVHILPNCLSTIMVQITLDIAYAILDLASLSFIGLGVQPPTADWGAMLDEGRNFLLQSPLLALAPGAAIIATVIAINIFGDSVQQYLDPVQRRLPSFEKLEKRTCRKAEAA